MTDGTATYYFKSSGPASIGGSNAVFSQATDTTTAGYATAGNYAVFSGLTSDTRTVSVQMRDNDEWGGIAAIQIVPKTDPLPTSRLQIELQPGSGSVLLSWPPGLGDVLLEESPDLVEWLPSDFLPVTNSVAVPVAHARRFFRLSRP